MQQTASLLNDYAVVAIADSDNVGKYESLQPIRLSDYVFEGTTCLVPQLVDYLRLLHHAENDIVAELREPFCLKGVY